MEGLSQGVVVQSGKFILRQLSKLVPRLQKRFFPFNRDHFIVTLQDSPRLNINEEIHLNILSIRLRIQNQTYYPVYAIGYRIETEIFTGKFCTRDSFLNEIYPIKEERQINLDIDLDYFEVMRFERLRLDNQNIHFRARIQFFTENKFGKETIYKEVESNLGYHHHRKPTAKKKSRKKK